MPRNHRRASALAIPAFALALLPLTGMSADATPQGKAAPRAAATTSLWTATAQRPAATLNGHKRSVNPSSFRAYRLNASGMTKALAGAPDEDSRAARRGGAP